MDDNQLFKVSLFDKNLNQEQILLRNEEGVFVVTPSLNQIFKFEGDTKGIEKAEILNEKPNKETIHAVTVVPMFAPKIIPIACVNDNISAFTKLTTITVVALED